MTAQINDEFRHKGKSYSLVGISESELFEISVLDLEPSATCSACWRGYQATFAIVESRLVLHSLSVNLLRPDEGGKQMEAVVGPTINGVTPSVPKKGFFNNRYQRLDYHLEYSGGLLLGDGFIQSLYVHMGFHPAWKYITVIELIFDGGVLIGEFDRSDRMAEFREMVSSSRQDEESQRTPTKDEIKQFVERAFDRSY